MRGTLRKKMLKTGKESLYIDYYPPVWNPQKQIYTRREFLKLYLHTGQLTSQQKKENQLYQEIADKIFLKRMKDLMLDANGFFNKDVLEADFFVFAADYIRKKQREKVDTTHYETAIKYLKRYTGGYCKFRHVDEKFLENFKDYLITSPSLKSENITLSQNSAASYYDKFAIIVQQAFLDKYLPED